MILDIDAGNTRIKWRAHSGGRPSADESAVGGIETLADDSLLDNIEQAIAADATIKRVRIASVRNSERLDALTAEMDKRWRVRAEFAATSAQACGVQNSYALPETMGVDRWCAVIAAAHLSTVSISNTPFCVIDAGSALTLDFVNAQGAHQGGHIVPGYAMQLQSLLGGTDRVFINNAPAQIALQAADNTGDAVLSGVLLSMTGLIEAALRRFTAEMGGSVVVIITGGDAELLQQHLPIVMQHEPDLVLDGLAHLMP